MNLEELCIIVQGTMYNCILSGGIAILYPLEFSLDSLMLL